MGNETFYWDGLKRRKFNQCNPEWTRCRERSEKRIYGISHEFRKVLCDCRLSVSVGLSFISLTHVGGFSHTTKRNLNSLLKA